MKQRYWFIFFVYISSVCLLPAQKELLSASEQAKLEDISPKSRQVDTLNEWAFSSEGIVAQQYAATALDLAQACRYPKGQGDAYVQLGSAAQDISNYGKAEKYYRLAWAVRLKLPDYEGAASCYNRLAQVKRLQGHYEEAVLLCDQGLQLMKGRTPHINMAYLYNTMGTSAKYAGHYALADSAFKAGILTYYLLMSDTEDRRKRLSYQNGLASLRMNNGAFLQETRAKYRAAKDSLLKSLADFKALGKVANEGKCLLLLGNNAYNQYQLDSARVYIEKGLALKGQIEERDYFILLRNRGRVAMRQGHYSPAYYDLSNALHFFSGLKANISDLADVRFEMGNWFYEQSRLDSAIFYYRSAVELDVQDPLLKGRILYFLSDALDLNGQKPAADSATVQYVRVLKDLHGNIDNHAFNLLIGHQLDKNRLLKRMMYEEKVQTQRLSLAGLGVLGLLLVLAFLALRLNRQKRRLAESEALSARQEQTIAAQAAESARQEQEMAEKNMQVAIQEKLDLLKSKELETHYARLEAQDDMQKQIGLELHDGVGALLTAVKLNMTPVDEVLDTFPSNQRNQYDKATRLLDEACQELRRVSHELGTALLAQFGLKTQLEVFASSLKESGKLSVELSLYDLEERFDKKMEVNVYRIVQELCSNIIKHAQANKVIIQVSRLDNMLNIMVEDNGTGFDLEQARQKPGQGLMSIDARVHDMKGELHIDTREGRGTTVSIDIPLFPKPD